MHNQSDTCCQPKEGIQIMFGKKKNQESLSMQKPNFLYIFTLTILKQICADFVLISIESKMKMKKKLTGIKIEKHQLKLKLEK